MTIDAWILFFIFLLETKDVLIVEKKSTWEGWWTLPQKYKKIIKYA